MNVTNSHIGRSEKFPDQSDRALAHAPLSHSRKKHDPKGFALLLVLIVVSIMGFLVFDFSYLVRVNMTSAANFRDGSQAYLLARSGIEACRALRREDKNEWDSLDELWATERPPVMVEGGVIEIGLTDENSKININKLANKQNKLYYDYYYKQLQRLFQLLELDSTIVDYIADWIDEDDNGEAENSYYRRLNPAYECKNGRLDTVHELLLVRGMTDDIFFGTKEKPGLVDFITTRAERGVNLNTAGPVVLQTLDDELTEDIAYTIIQARDEKPFKKLEDIKSRGEETGVDQDLFTSLTDVTDYITVQGDVYLARATATVDTYSVRVQALIEGHGTQIYFWKRY